MTELFEKIKNVFTGAAQTVTEKVDVEELKTKAEGLKDKVTEVGTDLVEKATEVGTDLKDRVTGGAEQATEAVAEQADTATDTVADVRDEVAQEVHQG
jgi:GTP1/Obg family GTP-binding protein